MNIDIRHLRYFQAVADERSFTRGAERLNMAQPPLSKRIQELEAEIGASLFERGQRPLRLTPLGLILHEQAGLVIESMERLQAVIRQATEKPRTRFTIGMVPSTLFVRLPQIVARFRERFPSIELRLAELDSGEQARALIDGRIDVGFDRIVVDDPLLRHEVMREEKLVAALPAGDSWLEQRAPVRLGDLARRPVLLYPKGPHPSYADHVLAVFRRHDVVPTSLLEVRELQTALVMVAAGAGICIVPDTVTRAVRPDIGFVDLAEEASVPLLIRFRKHDRSPALRSLLQVYEELHREWEMPFPTPLSSEQFQ